MGTDWESPSLHLGPRDGGTSLLCDPWSAVSHHFPAHWLESLYVVSLYSSSLMKPELGLGCLEPGPSLVEQPALFTWRRCSREGGSAV